MPHAASIGLIVILIALGLYRRIRRTVGFQPLSRGRMRTRIIVFLVIMILLLLSSSLHPLSYLYDAAGILVGAALALIGIRTTSFEQRARGWYYRPHPWIGVLLIALLVARIGIRMYEVMKVAGKPTDIQAQAAANNGFNTYASDPWTVLFLFVLFTYYVIYYFLVMRRGSQLDNTTLLDDQAES